MMVTRTFIQGHSYYLRNLETDLKIEISTYKPLVDFVIEKRQPLPSNSRK